MVNATTLVSEIGEALAKEPGVHFALLFRQDGRGYRISLRSRGPEQADVAAIARLFGGGGHRTAAGCGWTGALDEIFLP